MIKQYIKLFLESNEEREEDHPTFHSVLRNTSDELDRNQNQDSQKSNDSNNDNVNLNPDVVGLKWLLRNN